MWTRRRVIFIGVAGALAAGATVLIPRLRGASTAPTGGALVRDHGAMLRAVAQALLGPALPRDAGARTAQVDRLLTACEALLDNLPPVTRREVGDLFGLLAVKPARALLGLADDWADAGESVVHDFLAGLRDSRIGLKQQAYFALHDMVYGSFYAEPANWAAIGYPGPPDLL
ncbi:MAG: hypothetical protein LC098_10305 [Burkholderiales bacterium]|nr:hypothetical protein [Burkholderiales bacterium]